MLIMTVTCVGVVHKGLIKYNLHVLEQSGQFVVKNNTMYEKRGTFPVGHPTGNVLKIKIKILFITK